MKTFVLTTLAAAILYSFNAVSETKMFAPKRDDVSFPGGTWALNGEKEWISAATGENTSWDSADDTALIVNSPDSTVVWGSIDISIDNSQGNFMVGGIVITNEMPSWSHNRFEGDPLRIGSGGVTVWPHGDSSFVYFECPVILAAPQTWKSAKIRQVEDSATVQFKAPISSEGGAEIPIVFDGMNIVDPAKKGVSDARPAFGMYADNSFRGDVTVQNGAFLYLMYSQDSKGDKLDSSSAVILSGGGFGFTGNSFAYTQKIERLIIRRGENHISGKNANAVIDCGEIVREGPGGTLKLPVSWAGGITAFTSSTNVNSVLGCWATLNDGAFAKVGSDGKIGQENGIQRASTDSWTDSTHIVVAGGGVRTKGDMSPYSLRYANYSSLLAHTNDLAGSSLTLTMGGILANTSDESVLQNGALTSGLETGELFVFASNEFRIEANIRDNGEIPLNLVKSQRGILTCTSTSHSGTTFVNGGTLSLTGPEARIRGDIKQAGGTTISIENGAGFEPCETARKLGGNAMIGSGAVFAFEAGKPSETKGIEFTNPFAKVEFSAHESPVTFKIEPSPSGGISRGKHPLITWVPGVEISGCNIGSFELELPKTAAGYLETGPDGIFLNITSDSKFTVITVH